MGKTGDSDPNHDPNTTKESSMRNFPKHVFVGGLLAASLLASGYAAATDVFDEILEICLKPESVTVICAAPPMHGNANLKWHFE